MKLKSQCLKVLLCLMLLSPSFIFRADLPKVQALDTNIAEFNDIYVPELNETAHFDKNLWAYYVQAESLEKCIFVMQVHRDAYTIKNIRYNRSLRILTYETEPATPKFTLNISRDFTKYLAEGGIWASVFYGYQVSYSQSIVITGPSEYGWEQQVGWGGDYSRHSTVAGYSGHDENSFYTPGPGTYGGFYTGEAIKPNPSFSLGENYQNAGIFGDPTSIKFYDTYTDFTGVQASVRVQNYVKDVRSYPLIKNTKPTVSLTTQNNVTLQNEPGMNILNIEGYAQDPDNDDLNVVVEVPNVYYRKEKVVNTLSPQHFSIPIDVIADVISPGTYPVKVTVVDPYNMKAEASLSFNVKIRLKNKAFVLVNDPVQLDTKYTDYENDPKYAVRFKYDHDPYFFDNPMGMIPDSGLWQNLIYTSFPYSGVYNASFQLKDNPKPDDRFNEYRLWGRDNLSSMIFHVHRKPIALFSVKVVGGNLQIADISYDKDHTTSVDKGIYQWQWQYKQTDKESWIEGQPPAQLPTSNQYDIRLRVRDVDGENGIGVWSDWCQRSVGSSVNLPPVAMFTVDPSLVSYRKATTTIDKSYDPDNDPLDIYSWNVVKDGWQQVWSSWGGVTTPPNIGAYGVGNYQVTLQVHDNRGLWSEPYSQTVQVMNRPPAAAFYMPPEVYRDTVLTMENLTPDPDADGDILTYKWNGRLNGGSYYYAGSNKNQVMTVRSLMEQSGIAPKQAISDGWEMLLTASDGSLSSNATRSFPVKNHIPTAAIIGPATVYQYDTIQYNSGDADEDPSDVSSLQYYWKVTNSDGITDLYYTANISVDFPETGVYTLEHWAVDQIADKSNVAVLKVSVIKNLAPTITLTSPAGTLDQPTIIDAALQGDPLIQWTYGDPENDPQEKYRLEFYTKDTLLAMTVENTDNTGLIRQYQVPNPTFERFEYFSVFGRAFSKGSWSEISNEKAFIIDNPPVPGFTINQSLGHRNEDFIITSTATDADIPKGDSITYRYYLKPFGGTESLISGSSGFTKQFTTHGSFTFRQVVTDSLGLYRETSRNITVSNQIPTANITYPGSSSSATPTVVNTLTPNIQWIYQDADNDLQQRYKVRIIDVATNNIVAQSGETVSSAKQWTVTAVTLVENKKYAVEVEVYDGYDWSSISPRKYFMVNLLTIQGGVKHTTEWDNNRTAYNLKKSGDPNSPRGYSVFWAGERFILQADTTGLPDTVEVTMNGGYLTQLSPTSAAKTLWTGEMYDSSFENLPNGPITFTFTAQNQFNTKVDTVTVMISEEWSEYFQVHRTK
ncbi:MAG: hypothetical protein K6T94_01220 [Paenibacillus sp.]|nr:hypothetical protein [Paenibacillus sp.]